MTEAYGVAVIWRGKTGENLEDSFLFCFPVQVKYEGTNTGEAFLAFVLRKVFHSCLRTNLEDSNGLGSDDNFRDYRNAMVSFV